MRISDVRIATAHDYTLTPPFDFDHRQLTNRDAVNQHPISAIKGLQTALDNKYTKPSNGIPKTDLSSSVQNSLKKADGAVLNDDITEVSIAKSTYYDVADDESVITPKVAYEISKVLIVEVSGDGTSGYTIPEESRLLIYNACKNRKEVRLKYNNRFYYYTTMTANNLPSGLIESFSFLPISMSKSVGFSLTFKNEAYLSFSGFPVAPVLSERVTIDDLIDTIDMEQVVRKLVDIVNDLKGV